MLAIREHSKLELSNKLHTKGWTSSDIEQVLDELEQSNLQSDVRYTESLINVRRQKGYGPVYIQHYLREKGITAQIIESRLDFNDPAWQKSLFETAIKKYGHKRPTEFKDKAKQMNFLMRRGFPSEWIRNFYDNRNNYVDDYEDE